jgi:hypothetical protein
MVWSRISLKTTGDLNCLDFAQWKPNYASGEANPHIPMRNPGHHARGVHRNTCGRFQCCLQPDLLAYLERPMRHEASIIALVPDVRQETRFQAGRSLIYRDFNKRDSPLVRQCSKCGVSACSRIGAGVQRRHPTDSNFLNRLSAASVALFSSRCNLYTYSFRQARKGDFAHLPFRNA